MLGAIVLLPHVEERPTERKAAFLTVFAQKVENGLAFARQYHDVRHAVTLENPQSLLVRRRIGEEASGVVISTRRIADQGILVVKGDDFWPERRERPRRHG
jgi:hypothetical protein